MAAVGLISSFLLVSAVTYLLFAALRLPSRSLLFSRTEAQSFQSGLSNRLGMLLVVANFFGTLTSLATVYVFFLGTSKVFGGYVFFAPLTIFLGFIVTNHLTKAILTNNPAYTAAIERADSTSGVLSTVVWGESSSQRTLSSIIKWISAFSILGVIWLEFSVFGDIARGTLGSGFNTPPVGAAIVFSVAFLTVFLILRFGLRGFVFADMLQSPIIIIGSIIVLAGIVSTIMQGQYDEGLTVEKVLTPLAPMPVPLLFVAHVIVVNAIFVMVTEGHWFRLWLFKQREVSGQGLAALSTGAIWTVLAVIGCLAALITTRTGNDGVIDLVTALNNTHPSLSFAFWMAASAALFSTADAQIYGLLLVLGFQPKTGKMNDAVDRPQNAFLLAIAFGICFAALYWIVRHLEVPFEKLVFSIAPLCSNALPALVAVATKREPKVVWTVLALALYGASSAIGFVREESALAWTLAAALMPVLVTGAMLVLQSPKPALRS